MPEVSEAASTQSAVAQSLRRLVQRSISDEDFRQKLFDDPKGVVERELGRRLPEVITPPTTPVDINCDTACAFACPIG
jgi:hypothetical protein